MNSEDSYVEDLVSSFIEIGLRHENDFLKIKETLQRIGIAGKDSETKQLTLFQSCHVLHKRQRYYIVHFKELFALDGKKTDISEEDIGRRNTIADLLWKWELLTVLNPEIIEAPRASLSNIKILTHKEKNDWILASKYNLGKKRR